MTDRRRENIAPSRGVFFVHHDQVSANKTENPGVGRKTSRIFEGQEIRINGKSQQNMSFPNTQSTQSRPSNAIVCHGFVAGGVFSPFGGGDSGRTATKKIHRARRCRGFDPLVRTAIIRKRAMQSFLERVVSESIAESFFRKCDEWLKVRLND